MKKKKEFLKTAIVINKLELDATTENANNKTEQIIRDIIDPTPAFLLMIHLTRTIKIEIIRIESLLFL